MTKKKHAIQGIMSDIIVSIMTMINPNTTNQEMIMIPSIHLIQKAIIIYPILQIKIILPLKIVIVIMIISISLEVKMLTQSEEDILKEIKILERKIVMIFHLLLININICIIIIYKFLIAI